MPEFASPVAHDLSTAAPPLPTVEETPEESPATGGGEESKGSDISAPLPVAPPAGASTVSPAPSKAAAADTSSEAVLRMLEQREAEYQRERAELERLKDEVQQEKSMILQEIQRLREEEEEGAGHSSKLRSRGATPSLPLRTREATARPEPLASGSASQRSFTPSKEGGEPGGNTPPSFRASVLTEGFGSHGQENLSMFDTPSRTIIPRPPGTSPEPPRSNHGTLTLTDPRASAMPALNNLETSVTAPTPTRGGYRRAGAPSQLFSAPSPTMNGASTNLGAGPYRGYSGAGGPGGRLGASSPSPSSVGELAPSFSFQGVEAPSPRPGSPLARLDGSPSSVSVTAANALMTPSELYEEEVVQLFDQHEDQLRYLFAYYSRTADHLTLEQFLAIADDFDVHPTFVSRKSLRHIFHSSCYANRTSASKEDAGRLNYPGFLEALGRIALYALSRNAFSAIYPTAAQKVWDVVALGVLCTGLSHFVLLCRWRWYWTCGDWAMPANWLPLGSRPGGGLQVGINALYKETAGSALSRCPIWLRVCFVIVAYSAFARASYSHGSSLGPLVSCSDPAFPLSPLLALCLFILQNVFVSLTASQAEG